MYEKTFVTGITLRSPQIEPLMILVFISASLWGCLGCDKLPDGKISTEPMEQGEEITFSTHRRWINSNAPFCLTRKSLLLP